MTAEQISELWKKADAWTEANPSGTRCFVDGPNGFLDSRTIGAAWVCVGEVLVRVTGIVGGVQIDRVMTGAERKMYVDAAMPETEGAADMLWVWKRCENPCCRTKPLVRVAADYSGRAECNECWNR